MVDEKVVKEISNKILSVVDTYSKQYVGRDRTIRLITLALVSKQHIYMVSPPGTGKTMMENVARSFNMNVFYYLYGYDTKLEDILYNPIIRKVPTFDGEKIEIDYELKKPGVGTTDIHFADEMFKASTPVLNSLLGAMNERRVTLGGRTFKIPLWTLVAASNELPSEDAGALLDRFLFRDFISYLQPDLWTDYLIMYWNIHQPTYKPIRISVPREIIENANNLIWKVDIYGIIDEYSKLLLKLKEKNIVISDRRKGRILQAIASSAIIDGRLTAEPEDLEVLLYTVPTEEGEVDVVAKVLDEHLGGILSISKELDDILQQVSSFISNVNVKTLQELVDFTKTIPRLRNKVKTISFSSLHGKIERINTLIDEAEDIVAEEIAKRLLR